MDSVVKPGQASISDVISLVSFSLTLTALFAGWYSIRLQNIHSNLEAKLKATTDANTILQTHLTDRLSHTEENYPKDLDLHLEWPTRDLRFVSSRLPELRWKFAMSGPGIDYLIQMIWLGGTGTADPRASVPSQMKRVSTSGRCDFEGDGSCTFRATYPSAESTYIPTIGATIPEGKYLWRVVSINASSHASTYSGADVSNLSAQLFSNWSEFGSFCYYNHTPAATGCDIASESGSEEASRISTITPRQQQANFVVIGTSQSENVEFSWIENGRRGGHDVDLIRLIVEHCLVSDNESIRFEAASCLTAAETYRSTARLAETRRTIDPLLEAPLLASAAAMQQDHLRLSFRNFDTVEAGLEALSRREIDAFIGSLTGAQERQRHNIRLTRGYYPLKTALLLRTDDLPTKIPTLNSWLKSNRTLGVIEGSTNEWLAKKLTETPEFSGRLSVIAFPTFASVKEAFAAHHASDVQRLDGVLLDNVLGEELLDGNHRGLPEIQVQGTPAWAAYMRRLGFDHEEFVIAVKTDPPDDPGPSSWAELFHPKRMLGRLFEMQEPRSSLYDGIETALRSAAVQDVLPCIRAWNQIEVYPGTGRQANPRESIWCASASSWSRSQQREPAK